MTSIEERMNSMTMKSIIAIYRSGEGDALTAEFARLQADDSEYLGELRQDIEVNGIREPIELGIDGRIWNGHHRLCVAWELGLTDVPVVHVGTNAKFTKDGHAAHVASVLAAIVRQEKKSGVARST